MRPVSGGAEGDDREQSVDGKEEAEPPVVGIGSSPLLSETPAVTLSAASGAPQCPWHAGARVDEGGRRLGRTRRSLRP